MSDLRMVLLYTRNLTEPLGIVIFWELKTVHAVTILFNHVECSLEKDGGVFVVQNLPIGWIRVDTVKWLNLAAKHHAL